MSLHQLEEARFWVEAADREASVEEDRSISSAAIAQAHASIAIAEELRGMRVALTGVVETNHIPNGTVDRRLRVTDA